MIFSDPTRPLLIALFLQFFLDATPFHIKPRLTSQLPQAHTNNTDLGEIVQYLSNKNEIAPHLGNGEEEEDGELNIPVVSPSKRRRGRVSNYLFGICFDV